jgi:hypothetical protein
MHVKHTPSYLVSLTPGYMVSGWVWGSINLLEFAGFIEASDSDEYH